MSGAIAHGGGVAAAAARFGGRETDWLDLSTGINPCPPAMPAIDPRAWHRLPDASLERAAREAARDYYRSGDILPLPVPGTQSAIQMLPRLADPARCVAILSPTYGEYARAFEAAGFDVDPIGHPDEAGSRHGLVVVVNPNNPTGRAFEADALASLAGRLAVHGSLLVIDEAFADSTPALSLVPVAASHPNLIVFRSFGKFFGMAGVRLGFVIGSPAVLATVAEGLGPWAVSGPALSLAVSLMGGDTGAIGRRILERRAALDAVLAGAGLRTIGGTSLFALVEHGEARALHEHLCSHHILTRRFDYAPTWLRFGLPPDGAADTRLAAALASRSGA